MFDDLAINPVDSVGAEFQADDIAPKMNTGTIFDHFCGKYVQGAHGESIINGGIAPINGIVGANNMNKSTIADGMQLAAMDNYYPAAATMMINETEGSRTRQDMEDRLYKHYLNLHMAGLADNPRILLTNQTKMFGEEYWEKRLAYGAAKVEKKKKMMVDTPFVDRKGNFIKIMLPTFESIDSWSMLSFSATDLKAKKSDVSGKDRNMIFMNEGMYKTRILREMPRVNPRDGFYSFLAAHLGDKFNMDDKATPEKLFAHLKAEKTIKYATALFTFTVNNLWFVRGAKGHVDDKGIPIYGRDEAGTREDTDLQQTTVMNLRGKFGQSGSPFLALTSQTEGFLPHLTDLCYLRENGYYGMGSDKARMDLLLYPDMKKMTRNQVRSQIDEDEKLRRALEITRGLLQIRKYMWQMGDITQTPINDIFEKIKERKYDWDEILGGTTGQWQFNGVEAEKKFLSPMDIIRMAHGKYRPYWMGVSEH